MKKKNFIRQMPNEPLTMGLPVTIRSYKGSVRVTIGRRFIWFHGKHKGAVFWVDMGRVKRWGAADGPLVKEAEKELLVRILTEKSHQSPWMKLKFYDETGVICYGTNGKRQTNRKVPVYLMQGRVPA